MIIRKYEPRDLEQMTDIWNEIVEEGDAFPQEELLDLNTGAEFFASQSYCGVACDGERVYGLYILHPNNIGRCGHICNASYAVDNKMRGKHIGETLVKDCMKQAKKLEFKILQFNAVVATNERALRLYKKLGFTQLGVIPHGFKLDSGEYEDIIPHYIEL